jgi:hypothetical protein
MICVVLSADMACQGQVVFTGGSSLDIRMELLQVGAACLDSLLHIRYSRACCLIQPPSSYSLCALL